MDKNKKLTKIRKNIIPRICGVESWKIEWYKLHIYLNSDIHFSIELRDDFAYHLLISKITESTEECRFYRGQILSGHMCKNSTEITNVLKKELMKDKDYKFISRKEKLERIVYE